MGQSKLTSKAPRHTLMKLLDELLERQFIYIHAPAGFGKTVSSLLWLEHREKQTDTKHTWVGLDEHDNQMAELCRRLVVGLSNLQPENTALCELVAHPAFNISPVEFILHALSVFAEKQESHIFVLDDLHNIKNPKILDLIPTLLKGLPKNCAVLMLSRNLPPDSFAEMVTKDELAIVNADYLQFTSGEIKIFFDKNGCAITNKQADAIFASTGGWALGIRAMLLSEEELFSTDLTEKYFENFLKTHVWEQWDDRLKRFMTLVAVMEELTPELCDWLIAGDKLLKKTSGAQILSELVRENAFIRKTDKDTYRFHDLFRDFLLTIQDDVRNEQLKKAGEWFYEHKDHYRAVDYFLKCGYISGIAKGLKLMYDHSSAHPLIEDSLDLIRISLNNAVLDKYPFLLELQIWMAYMEGRGEDFEAHVDSYFKCLPKIILQNPVSIQTSVVVYCSDYRNSLVSTTRKLSKLPLTLFSPGHTPPITQSLPLFHRSGRDFSEYSTDTTKKIKLLSKTISPVVGDAMGMVECILSAGMAYERGNLSEAHELALSAHVKMRDHFAPEFKFCAFMILAYVLEAQNDRPGLKKILGSTSEMIEADRAYFLYENYNAYQCRLRLYEGDRDAAMEWLGRRTVSPYDRLSFYKIYSHFTTARAHIVAGQYSAAVLFLQKLLALSESYRRPLDIIEARILLDITHWKIGKGSLHVAIEHLEQAAALAQTYEFTQIFANEGPELVNMLHRLQKRSVQKDSGVSSEFAKTLYVCAVSRSKNTKGLTGGRIPRKLTFTDKQKTVMSLMCKGYSRKGIAEQMGIKPNGVKAHVELIYNKLDVMNNVEAIMKIEELGLLAEIHE